MIFVNSLPVFRAQCTRGWIQMLHRFLLLSLSMIAVIRPGLLPSSEHGYTGISEKLPTGSRVISEEGLVAAFDFETYTEDGLLNDFGPNENHGKVERTITAEGLFGRARSFSQVADRVDLPERNCFDLNGPLTIAAWVQIKTLDLHQHLIACDDKFVLWVTEKNEFRFGDTRGHGLTTLEGSALSGDWHSIVAVFYGTLGTQLSSETIKLFIDGKEAEGAYDRQWIPTSLFPYDACYIGFESHQNSKAHRKLQFEGIIDEMLLFSRPLTIDEIQVFSTRSTSEGIRFFKGDKSLERIKSP